MRGNVQPGDVILAIVNRGQTTEAKSAEQVNGASREARQGRIGDVPLKRGEQEFFSTLKLNNGE